MSDTSKPLTVAVHTGLSLRALGAIEMEYEERGFRVFHVRAEYCQTWPELHREFSAALQFPWYYGNNSAALEECLSEIGDLDPTSVGVVVSIWNCSALFRNVHDRSQTLERFQDLFAHVATEMADPSGVVVGSTYVRRSLVLLLHDDGVSQVSNRRSLREVVMGLS